MLWGQFDFFTINIKQDTLLTNIALYLVRLNDQIGEGPPFAWILQGIRLISMAGCDILTYRL